MKILDRAALVIGVAGMWLYMASVEQDRWSRAVLSVAIVVLAFVLKKISDRIAERREEQEEVLRLLHPVTSSYKVAKCQNGAYRRAYVEVAINRQQNGEEVKKY